MIDEEEACYPHMETQEDSSSSSSSSSSDDDNSDDDSSSNDELDEDSKLMQNYFETFKRIEENKYSYDDYVLLVDIALNMTELERIRESFELFSLVFPLSPMIWMKLLKLEVNIANNDEEIQNCRKVFQLALGDYFSATVAQEYTNLAFKASCSKDIWDDIIPAYTLDCMKGRFIFQAWREDFQQKNKNMDPTERNLLLAAMYEKELSIPLHDMENTYIELKVLCEKDKLEVDWEDINETYKKTKKVLQQILPFENKLAELDPKSHQDRAETFKQYIQECQYDLDEHIIQVLYERMITECCLNPTVWLEYIKYIQNRSRKSTDLDLNSKVFKQTDLDVCNRALRNCTGSHDLYIEKMRILERLEVDRKEIQAIIETTVSIAFPTPEPMVEIWQEYLSYLRRNSNFENEKEKDIIRSTFELAWDSLGRQWGALADTSCEILKLWGELEYNELGNTAKGKELWTTVMESAENPSNSALWIEYAHLEGKRGIDAARKVYKKAISSTTLNDPTTLVSTYIRFERLHGTLDQLKYCQNHCNQIMQTFKHQQYRQNYKNQDNHKNRSKDSKQMKKKVQDDEDKLKKNREYEFKKPFPMMKQLEPNSPSSKPVNNLDYSEFEETGESTKNRKRAFVTKIDDVKMAESVKRVKLEDKEKVSEKVVSQEYDKSKDNLKVFFSNLVFDITEEEIKNAFTDLNIVDVNLIKGSSGKGRGFAYIQLESSIDVSRALSFDRRPIKDRPVYISNLERDKNSRDRSKLKYSESFEPNKLFVKGLPFDLTKEELTDMFKEFGVLKDARLVYYKSGQPKGIAFIEFENESSASKAVLKMDQKIIRGYTISVALSSPPPKNLSSSTHTISLGNAKRTVLRGEQKPRMSLIPSVVQKKVSNSTNSAADTPEATNKPKSNADFRKLLLK